MKYLLILLVSAAALLISVNGKIPSYIHICKRNDPQLTKCVENSILNLRDKLIMGIPELKVPSLDPLHIERLSLNLGPGLKAEARNLKAIGGRNFELRDLIVDVDKNTYSFVVSLPEINANGTYEIDAAVAGIPLKGTGPVHIRATSVIGRGTLHGQRVMRRGKTFNWFPTMDLKLDVGDYEVTADNLFGGDTTLSEVTRKLLYEERAEILTTTLPELERVLIEYFLLSANNIVKTFTWDELFPES